MKTLVLSTLLLAASTANASHGVGNGGGAHVCYNTDGSIKSVEFYDLYEGRNRYFWKQDESLTGSTALILDRVGLKITANGMDSLSAKLAAAIKLAEDRLTETDTVLQDALDARKVLVDEGCKYEQLLNWDERADKLFFNPTLMAALDPKSRAAMLVHEALYWLVRRYDNPKTINSDNVREYVARLFSTDVGLKTELVKEGQKSGVIQTSASDYEGSRTYSTSSDAISNYYNRNTARHYLVNWSKEDCYDYLNEDKERPMTANVYFAHVDNKKGSLFKKTILARTNPSDDWAKIALHESQDLKLQNYDQLSSVASFRLLGRLDLRMKRNFGTFFSMNFAATATLTNDRCGESHKRYVNAPYAYDGKHFFFE